MTWAEVFNFLLHWVLSTGATVIVLLGIVPTKLGDKFLGHIFDRKLSDIKHKHDRDIVRLHADLDHLADRGVRSNEKEFQAIEIAWKSFVDAYAATTACAVAFSRHPDLAHLKDEDTKRYLESTGLSEQQRNKVMEATTEPAR
jgi:hypothetical protein